MYLTYPLYKDLGGTAEELYFTRLLERASAILNRQTFGRLKNCADLYPEIKYMIFEMIERLELTEILTGNNDGVGLSIDKAGLIRELEQLPIIYLGNYVDLDGAPLFYKGVCQ